MKFQKIKNFEKPAKLYSFSDFKIGDSIKITNNIYKDITQNSIYRIIKINKSTKRLYIDKQHYYYLREIKKI